LANIDGADGGLRKDDHNVDNVGGDDVNDNDEEEEERGEEEEEEEEEDEKYRNCCRKSLWCLLDGM
jgi:hypothetical protein